MKAVGTSFAVTLRVSMDTADPGRAAAALKKVIATAQDAGFTVEETESLRGEWHSRAGELGEDRQVGMEPHPVDPSHAKGQ